MTGRKRACAVVLGLAGSLAATFAIAADETSVVLKAGTDADLTRARCSICHSPDYIIMDSVFLKRAGWDAEVHKMMKAMGAPISEDEAARIVDYLARNYAAE